MPRHPRFIPTGSLVEVTNRTFQGRFLLRPSPELNRIVLGVLGRAQSTYPIEIHHFTFMSNHFHMLVTPDDAQRLAEFMRYFKGNLSKEISRHLGWKGAMWEGRYDARLVHEDEASQIKRLDYIIGQGCKENLVASPTAWPGAKCLRAWISDKDLDGLWFDRTSEWAARQRSNEPNVLDHAETETVVLTPLPCWRSLPDHQVRSLVAARARLIEEETRQRHRREGTRPIGRRAVLAEDPLSRPAGTKSAPALMFHASTKEAFEELRQAMSLFVQAYYAARDRLRRGLHARFPDGSFPSPLALVPL